jgi:hypothetical protein
MATGGDAMGKINSVTDRGWRQIRGKNKTERFEFSKVWIGSFFYPVFQKIRTRLTPLPTNVDQLSSYGDTVNLKTFS